MASGRIGGFRSPRHRAWYDAVYGEALRTLPEPAAVHDVPTAFGVVRAYRFGDTGAPVVLLPGRAGTSVMFRPQVAALAARYRVHTLDPLGEPGCSEQTAPIRTAADQAAWLAQTLSRLGLDRPHLVGVSLGGRLAVELAVRAPDNVASLGLIDPVATFAPVPPGMILRALPAGMPLVSSWARPRFLTWVDGRGGDAVAGDPVGRLISAGLQHYRFALPAPRPCPARRLRAISMPTLVLFAGRSVVHDPVRALARARALVPGVEAELWPEATHAISGQCAERVNARLLRFLSR
ncbi:alpha/beta hydrolase [Amycolatopsis rhizosphaerae]|uniref:Alpha/beta hydrolase n=1 Tax=Amycolatopsis rhizosphaerae TaxID=2053003 RepID=A0A558CH27_9PSEU|nr:alpha/beta hydrolase [Amycolatopsis rhizosphaerae]TVT48079.1 alpha/beta hydrolase [Amycolatopsis rhizosphaerae]